MDNPRIVGPRLLPEGTVRYPVNVVVTAYGLGREVNQKGEVTNIRHNIYNNTFQVGIINVEKLMTNNSETDLALITVGTSMKMPDIIPKPYSSCEVQISMTFVGKRDNFEGEVDAALQRVGGKVQDSLNKIAIACGGIQPFNKGD